MFQKQFQPGLKCHICLTLPCPCEKVSQHFENTVFFLEFGSNPFLSKKNTYLATIFTINDFNQWIMPYSRCDCFLKFNLPDEQLKKPKGINTSETTWVKCPMWQKQITEQLVVFNSAFLKTRNSVDSPRKC